MLYRLAVEAVLAVGLAMLAATRRRAPAEKQTQYSLRHFACGCAGQSEDSQHGNSAAASLISDGMVPQARWTNKQAGL